MTRNVGKAGAFITTGLVPPIASPVQVVLTFGVRSYEGLQVRLSGAGSVRHTQHESGDENGFGAGMILHTEPVAG